MQLELSSTTVREPRVKFPPNPWLAPVLYGEGMKKGSPTTGEPNSSENEVKTLGLRHVSPNCVGAG